jgi:hypothetical protein
MRLVLHLSLFVYCALTVFVGLKIDGEEENLGFHIKIAIYGSFLLNIILFGLKMFAGKRNVREI